ncbi:DUF4091 domain-containing protein, partial [Candidatus Bathyarchaeota archaeon]|nr:DUF4091 domain-containing protein [Candidatus Bathyarchaeota archaeon]
GIPGWLYWSFNYGMDMDGGYGYAGFGESNLVDIGPGNTPVSSLRLERVRDGIEDYEYFWLLNETIDGLIAAGTNMSLDLAGNATILLDRVASTFNQPEHLNNLPVLDTDDFELFKRGYNPYSGTYLSIRGDIGVLLGTIKSEGY